MHSTQNSYDVIIIGSGQAGNPLALALGNAGKHTAIVERRHVGGTCINEGCTPTKAMVASAQVAHLAIRASEFGVSAGPVEVNLPQVIARKARIVDSFRSPNRVRLESAEKVDLIWGSARFQGPKTISITGDEQLTQIEGATIVLNTGARPRIPEITGLAEVDYLTSRTILELEELPDRLVIVGGGYIGVEFGQMFRRFGSQVTILTHGPQLLGREDEDIAEEVLSILQADGISIELSARPSQVRPSGEGLEVAFQQDGRDHHVRGSHLLLAAGRVPNTPDLNLKAAGVATDKRGFIQVDSSLRTNVDGIYAVGDVKGGPAFTHISYDDFRVLRDSLLHGGARSIDNRPVPYTLFMDPQLGRIGLSEKEARRRHIDYQVATMPMSYVARAIETDQTRGMMKALVDPDTGMILGAAVLGTEGGELMGALQIAMMGGVTSDRLREATFAHPTLMESFNNLFASLRDPQ